MPLAARPNGRCCPHAPRPSGALAALPSAGGAMISQPVRAWSYLDSTCSASTYFVPQPVFSHDPEEEFEAILSARCASA